MDVFQPERKHRGLAREHNSMRKRKQMVKRHDLDNEARPHVDDRQRSSPRTYYPSINRTFLKGPVLIITRDIFWYIRHNTFLLTGVITAIILIFGLFLGAHILGGRIFPNVWALGIDLGNMTTEEAASILQNKWWGSTQIQLRDSDRIWSATPSQIGLTLDAAATVSNARAAGLSGMPFGYSVMPIVRMDALTAQNFLLDMTEQSKILPSNASFRWDGDNIVGVSGADGRYLDVARTMMKLQANLPLVVTTGVLDLSMTISPPDARDPTPFLTQARAFTTQSFVIKGYDPFTDEYFAWTTDRNTLTSWLEVDGDGLSLRPDTFAAFVQAQTDSLARNAPDRYIEPNNTMEKMREAISELRTEVSLRIHYRPSIYIVVPGDSGYMIARRKGIPFYQLQLSNPGRDWDVPLVVGETMNLPSPDITVPLDPIPNKRIVVNLSTQSMIAYENGQPVFSWLIASGMDRAPTTPGIYQIISHAEVAKGGSSELCSELGCAQWTMYWFMGIYEVVPGLINGFHGSVLLANGRLLGDGNTGMPLTYGCIMADDDNAKALYDWAEEGTMVEILSPIYEPRSALGREMLLAPMPI